MDVIVIVGHFELCTSHSHTNTFSPLILHGQQKNFRFVTSEMVVAVMMAPTCSHQQPKPITKS